MLPRSLQAVMIRSYRVIPAGVDSFGFMSDQSRSGQDVDVGQLIADLVDEVLEQIRHGYVHDGEDRRADDDNDQNFHRHVEVTLAAIVPGQVLEVHTQGGKTGAGFEQEGVLPGKHLIHGHLSIHILDFDKDMKLVV